MDSENTTEQALTVSQAVALVNSSLRAVGTVCVIGEVSGFKGPNWRSGHCYFEIKDAEATLAATIWSSSYKAMGFEIEDGQQLVMYGTFDVYKGSGKMSFIIRHAEIAGEGQLRQQVALLAKKLAAEGLMDPARKRPIPRFCERIVVCTSYSGSVLHDVEQTLARRNPLVVIDTVECAVQGAEAPASIIRALAIAAKAAPDAILLVRGGGSFEDLMCFNDEQVARAIAASPVPVVTGIGHEPDTSIADMVSDLRASTPTAAAEQVAPSMQELADACENRARRLASSMEGKLAQLGQSVSALASRPCLTSPYALIDERKRELARIEERMDAIPQRIFDDRARDLDHAEERLYTVLPHLVDVHATRTAMLSTKLDAAALRICQAPSAHIERLSAALAALSPLAVLGRGYAIVRSEEGHVVSSPTQAHVGDALTIQLADGNIQTTVTATHEGRNDHE